MSSLKRFQFPDGFLWGAATASYQIEGAVDRDGRKPSVWDTFCQKPGAIADKNSGKDACRHYDLWEQDLDLIKGLNLNSYRFSIAWPRILPEGRGAVNEKGLDFYERLIDGMLKRGIKPNATLYHWDLPQPLEDAGGWMNRDTAKAYADYAAVVLKRLGKKLDMVATFNEPQVFIWLGYHSGVHAPGRKEPLKQVLQGIHHVLLGHGLAMQSIRAHAPQAKAGIVMAPSPVWPVSGSAEDLAASEIHWEDANDWWMGPLLKGAYPAASLARRGADAPEVQPGDLEVIRQKMDFLGINYYSPARTTADATPQGYKCLPRPEEVTPADMPGWEVWPAGLENVLVQFATRYPGLPFYVTENGLSVKADQVGPDGEVHDPKRVDFLKGHLIHCRRAMEQGVDLRGYFVWSLMDNFEWGFGYTQRFGITHIDYQDFKRTVKDSGKFYAAAAAANGFEAEDLPPLTAPWQKVKV